MLIGTMHLEKIFSAVGVKVFCWSNAYRMLTCKAVRKAVAMMMMMKFMFNVAAMTWMMSDSRIWA